MMDVTQAASKLKPGTAWNARNGVLEQAIDGTPRVAPPSKAELDPLIVSDDYVLLRLKEAPSIQEQLDAIWQGGLAQQQMKATMLALYAKYPKP